ncbi:MAG TPA: response regulator, partial [Polyangiaceae bacterium]|nr:response regulator [Polyangiaceae bacterium]
MSTHQVLIVEDNLADAELTSELLAAAQVARFNVLRAATAVSAVETLKSVRVDAVLLDLNLPDSRGLETLRQVKPKAADAPIIVLSGMVTPELLVQARHEGAEEVFDKDESNTPLLSLSVLYVIERTRSRVQQKQLEALLDATADAIVVVSASGEVQYVNQAALTLFGRKREEFDHVLPGFAVSDGRAAEVTIQTRDEDRICEMRVVPIEWRRQAARLASIRDITRQRKLEMQLMVSDRMASIGTMAAGVAHEINNPLASVIGNLQLACDTMEQWGANNKPPGLAVAPSDPPPLPANVTHHQRTEIETEQVLEELYDAREAAERVRQIVRDLRVFARSEDERREPVDVQRVIESALRMAWNELRHRATVVRRYTRVPPVLATEARLGQVVLNLLVNAAQSIPEGDSARNEVRVSTGLDDQGRIVIAIADTGSGMPPEVQRRLFTPFYSTKPPGSG